MEVINWANGQGYTLRLDKDELEELTSLLKSFEHSYFVRLSSEHFEVEMLHEGGEQCV